MKPPERLDNVADASLLVLGWTPSLAIPSGKEGTSGHPSSIEAVLDIAHLDAAVEFFFSNGLAKGTQRSYGSAKRRYVYFCMHPLLNEV